LRLRNTKITGKLITANQVAFEKRTTHTMQAKTYKVFISQVASRLRTAANSKAHKQ